MSYRRDDHMFVHVGRPAKAALRRLKEDPSYADGMVVIVFTAFMLEAHCNHIGRLLMDARWDSPAQKTRKIDDKIDTLVQHYSVNWAQWANDIRRLLDLREIFAHGVTSSIELTEQQYRQGQWPDWFEECKLENVQRMHDSAYAFMRAVHAAAGRDPIEFVTLGSSGNVHIDRPHGPPKPRRRNPKP